MAEQNFANHTRWYPLAHFVIAPIALANLIYQGVKLYRHPSYDGIWMVVIALTLILLSVAARLQALKAQDRVIRLEERMRYASLLTPELARKASELPIGTIIAMRFASDAELPEIASAAVEGKFSTSKDLKQAIKQWKVDDHRV